MLELLVNGIAVGCIYSLIGLGFTMIIRSTDILNFAQGENGYARRHVRAFGLGVPSAAVSGNSCHRNGRRGRRFGLHRTRYLQNYARQKGTSYL
jgi:hypothetical protein